MEATFESVLESARQNKWSRKQTRSELYKLNCPELWARRDELMAALGFATTDQTAVAQQAAAEQSKQEAARQVEETKARMEATRLAAEEVARQEREAAAARQAAALAAITDGAEIWCDACENTVVRVVNSYGRQSTFDNGGYRAGIKIGDYEAVFYNRQCPDQFAAECWSVLKAVEVAAERGLKLCTVRNDRIGGFEACNGKSIKRGYIGAKYLYVASKIASENGIAVNFEPCSSADNLADAVCRRPGKVN